MLSHYLNQCQYIVNWILRNKLQWNCNQNSYFFIKKMHVKMLSAKYLPILSWPQCVKLWSRNVWWSGTFDRFIMYAINISSSGICLGMRSTNERHRYIVRTSLIGWAHSWTDYWSSSLVSLITAKFLFRLTQSLWNLTSLLATLLLRHLSNIKTIHQFRYPILHLQGFIWSCDKHHIVYWQDTRGLFY